MNDYFEKLAYLEDIADELKKEAARASSLAAIKRVAGAKPGALVPGTGRVPKGIPAKREIRRGSLLVSRDQLRNSKPLQEKKYWAKRLRDDKRDYLKLTTTYNMKT